MLLLFMVGSMLVGIMVALSIGVATLRWSITLVNGMIGGGIPRECDYVMDTNSWTPKLKNPGSFRITEPNFGTAAAAVLIPGMLNFMIVVIVAYIFKGVAMIRQGPGGVTKAVSDLAGESVMTALLPVLLLIRVGLLGALLRTSFARAFAVALGEVFIWVFIILMLAFILILTGQIATPSFLRGVV